MTKTYKLLCVSLLVICFNCKAQGDLFYKGSQIAYAKVDNEFIAISQRPVTNREYIIYLMWLRNTFMYEPKYCNFFYYNVPGLNVDSISEYVESINKGYAYRSVDMNTVIDYSKPFVRDYMFNPKYLDYPVVGVSWQNANNYGKWLSDRFNEVTMIKKKLLSYNCFSSTYDYFDTGFYMAGLWQGQLLIKLPEFDGESNFKDFTWNEHVFVPAFRLPSKNEVTESNIEAAVSDFKAYPFSKKHFLFQWHKQYFHSEKDTSYILTSCYTYEGYSRDTITNSKNFSIKITGELFLNDNQPNNKNIPNIYFKNGQDQHTKEFYIEEDSKRDKHLCELGILNPCIIIDEDKNQNPIYMSEYENIQLPDYVNFKCFRLVCSMGRKQYAKVVEK